VTTRGGKRSVAVKVSPRQVLECVYHRDRCVKVGQGGGVLMISGVEGHDVVKLLQ